MKNKYTLIIFFIFNIAFSSDIKSIKQWPTLLKQDRESLKNQTIVLIIITSMCGVSTIALLTDFMNTLLKGNNKSYLCDFLPISKYISDPLAAIYITSLISACLLCLGIYDTIKLHKKIIQLDKDIKKVLKIFPENAEHQPDKKEETTLKNKHLQEEVILEYPLNHVNSENQIKTISLNNTTQHITEFREYLANVENAYDMKNFATLIKKYKSSFEADNHEWKAFGKNELNKAIEEFKSHNITLNSTRDNEEYTKLTYEDFFETIRKLQIMLHFASLLSKIKETIQQKALLLYLNTIDNIKNSEKIDYFNSEKNCLEKTIEEKKILMQEQQKMTNQLEAISDFKETLYALNKNIFINNIIKNLESEKEKPESELSLKIKLIKLIYNPERKLNESSCISKETVVKIEKNLIKYFETNSSLLRLIDTHPLPNKIQRELQDNSKKWENPNEQWMKENCGIYKRYSFLFATLLSLKKDSIDSLLLTKCDSFQKTHNNCALVMGMQKSTFGFDSHLTTLEKELSNQHCLAFIMKESDYRL
jgi:hypothetical protein